MGPSQGHRLLLQQPQVKRLASRIPATRCKHEVIQFLRLSNAHTASPRSPITDSLCPRLPFCSHLTQVALSAFSLPKSTSSATSSQTPITPAPILEPPTPTAQVQHHRSCLGSKTKLLTALRKEAAPSCSLPSVTECSTHPPTSVPVDYQPPHALSLITAFLCPTCSLQDLQSTVMRGETALATRDILTPLSSNYPTCTKSKNCSCLLAATDLRFV